MMPGRKSGNCADGPMDVRAFLADRFGLDESEITYFDDTYSFKRDDCDGPSLSVEPDGMLELNHGAFCLRADVDGDVVGTVERAMAALTAFGGWSA